MVAALEKELASAGIEWPVFLGNRNWRPLLADTLREMTQRGLRRALGLFTSPYSSYSSCRQYLENIEAARREVGEDACEVDKLRAYFNHPGFIEPMAERLSAYAQRLGHNLRFYRGELTDWDFVVNAYRSFRPEAVVYLGEMPSAPFSMIDVHHAVFTQTNNVIFDQGGVQIAGIGGKGGGFNLSSDTIFTGSGVAGGGGDGYSNGSTVDVNIGYFHPINIAVPAGGIAEADQLNHLLVDQHTLQIGGIGGAGGEGNIVDTNAALIDDVLHG